MHYARFAGFVAIFASLVLPASGWADGSNSLMDLSPDGKWLACSNRDSGTVTIVDLASRAKLHEVRVGAKPEGVSFIGSTDRIAVAVYGDDRVRVVSAATGELVGDVDVYDEPYGVVSDPEGQRIYVTLDYPGRLVEIDARTLSITRETPVGSFSRGVAFSAGERRIYVVDYYSATMRAVDADSFQVVDEWPASSSDNLARQITLHPSRPKAYVPNIRSRVSAAHGQGSIFPYVTVLDRGAGDGKRRKRIPMDAFLNNYVTANPWEIAVSPDGRSLFVVFAATNDLFACDLIDDDYREIGYRGRIQLGANPRAVRVARDGRTFFVYNALDFNVVAYDTQSLAPIATIAVTENPLDEQVLLGKRLFYSALQPMVGLRWISCASCHPDGEPDSRTWRNPEGLRNTQALAGMAWTHPIHWSADRDEVQDFEHTIRGPLMQGQGLVRGAVSESLADPNKGLAPSLDALAAYANSHKFSFSPHAKGGLTEGARRGREVFFSSETQCVTCHSGPFFTDSKPAPAAGRVRHDVGTGRSDRTEILGTAYDTPTLLGIYRTAPYMHDGSAATLEELLTTGNPRDVHGKTSGLSSAQVADLVEFLKSLPFEDPIPEAVKAGRTPVGP